MDEKREVTDYIVIHCAATPPTMDIGVSEIRSWHQKRGFYDVGYHYIIRRDGTREKGRDIGAIGAHCIGHNHHSVGVCLVGGTDKMGQPENNFTEAQWTVLYLTMKELHETYPQAVIVGHRDLNARKACPSFSVSEWVDDKAEFAPVV